MHPRQNTANVTSDPASACSPIASRASLRCRNIPCPHLVCAHRKQRLLISSHPIPHSIPPSHARKTDHARRRRLAQADRARRHGPLLADALGGLIHARRGRAERACRIDYHLQHIGPVEPDVRVREMLRVVCSPTTVKQNQARGRDREMSTRSARCDEMTTAPRRHHHPR